MRRRRRRRRLVPSASLTVRAQLFWVKAITEIFLPKKHKK
jgi:hypothetical protein